MGIKTLYNTILFFNNFQLKTYSFCLNFALPRPTRRAQVQSEKITTLEKRQFIHALKALKQGLKVQEKDDFLAFGVK